MAKPYKCRVEYLESTGTQYIYTGINTSVKLKFQVDTQFDTYSSSYQLHGAYYNSQRFMIGVNASDYYSLSYVENNTTDIQNDNKRHLFEIDALNKTYSIDGVQKGTFSSDISVSCSLYLFARRTTNGVDGFIRGRVYGSKIYNDNILVRDFIPVLDNSGKPAMYDQVSGKLFYNQGTGEFTYGRQIIPVEYLYTGDDINCMTSSPFTSTSYRLIDTKETIDLTSVVEIKFAFDKNIYYSGCGLRNSTSSTAQSIYFPAAYSTENKIGWTIGSGEEQRQKFTLDTNDHTIRVDLPNSNVVWDNVNYPIENLTHTPSSRTFPLFAFSDVRATQENGYRFPMQGKIYYAKFWKNGVLTRDFIPAVDENNIGFMFDKVNNTVYLNEGTGQFKVGPYKADNLNKKLLRKKLDLMLATLKKKRKYYCEVEYLKSNNGNQYINTGYTGNSTTRVIIGASSSLDSSNIPLFGARDTNGYYNSFSIWQNTGANGMRFDYTDTTANVVYSHSWLTTGVNIIEKNGRYNYVNGVQVTSNNEKTFSCNNPFYLMAINTSGIAVSGFIGSVSFCKIYDNGTLVRDFIPVLDWDYVPCMYDKVTEQLFYNAGTGDFVAGREIHPVEYLEGTGTQYIDTGLDYFADFEVSIQLRNNVSNKALGNGSYNCMQRQNSANPTWQFTNGSGNFYNSTTRITEHHIMKWKDNKIYSDDVLLTEFTKDSNTPNGMYLYGIGATNKYPNIIYFCKLFNPTDGTLVRDYIPAIDENGVGYMFDQITHTIFDNAGTGAFNYPPVELEYLESTGTQYIDMGVGVKENTIFKATFSIDSSATGRSYFGARNSSNERFQIVNSIGIGSGYFYNANVYPIANKKYEIEMRASGEMYLDGVKINATNGTFSSVVFERNLWLFGTNYYDSSVPLGASTFWKAQVLEGDVLVRDLIPCYKDGALGMWDKINNVFYPNAGTGTFTTGKIVEPKYE